MGRKDDYLLAAIGVIPAVWAALLIAPFWEDSIFDIISEMDAILTHPFRIQWTECSLKAVLFCLAVYATGISIWLSARRNYRHGEEYGSARWGSVRAINKKYRQKPDCMNKILTQNVRIGFDAHKHRRNLNILVIGGSGAGKTRFFVKPNVMQANCSMVVLDPKGELSRSLGNLLLEKGYKVLVLDLLDMKRSHCYNPFVYIRSENDVQRLVTNLFKATSPKGSKSSEPFWDIAAQMLLMAIIFYLKCFAPIEEQNFSMVMEMLRAGEVDEEDRMPSALDNLFYDLRKTDPDHIALKYYDAYHSGSAKTLKSIQITLASRLEKFNLESVASLTITDELELWKMGEEKTALFAIIPDNDTSFNFIVSMLYNQLFQQLFEVADRKYNGSLPVPVHLIMDEFSNVQLPSDFEKILSVMRSRGVSVSIILQNLSQLKALFEKEWQSIVGNCDELLYLGGNERDTHKYVSELIGKETIDTNTYSRSSGRSGNYTKNNQKQARELMTADEVRMLDNRYAILFIRGERPIIDLKYDILKHPDVRMTTDGQADAYLHGQPKDAAFTLRITIDPNDIKFVNSMKNVIKITEGDYVLLSEEDVEKECGSNS